MGVLLQRDNPSSIANLSSGPANDQSQTSPRFNDNQTAAANAASNFVSKILRRSDECTKDEACGRPLSPNATSLVIALGVV
jgi:hypothetical protein